jgi:hypothetical protein
MGLYIIYKIMSTKILSYNYHYKYDSYLRQYQNKLLMRCLAYLSNIYKARPILPVLIYVSYAFLHNK